MRGRWIGGLAAIAAVLIVGACDDEVTQPGDQTFAFSFDAGLEGWASDGTDLLDPPVAWSIEHTFATGNDADGAVELFLENLNDAGKIWLERSFDLEPNTTYDVTVSYAFATEDFGIVNLWTLITGVTTESPESVADLVFQGDTGTGEDTDMGYVWLEKSYSFTAQTDADGELWVSVGVWGTFETPRTYFVDDLEIRFEKE